MTESSRISEARRWRRRRMAYYAGLALLFSAIAFYVGPNLILFDKLTWLAPADFVPIARQECWPIVRGMKQYQRDHRVLPTSADQLVPGYLPAVSPAASIWGGEFNYYSTQFNHVIVYRFSSADEGWYVRGAYVDGRIPLPSVPADAGPATSTAPATTMNAATHPE